jgi:flavin reductase ActVB
MPVDPNSFTAAMSHVASPVAVVTTADDTGRRWGFTASSFCSLSLDPPLVLVCLAKTAGSHHAFTAGGTFIVNVLAEDHAEVARHFAVPGADKFAAGRMIPCELGLPGLGDALVRLVCDKHAVLDGGDHSILLGRVDATSVLDRTPLIYHNRSFTRPQPKLSVTGQ